MNGSAAIPLVITAPMRAKLGGLGFTDPDINQMTPADAWEIISNNSVEAAPAPAPMFVVRSADLIPPLPKAVQPDHDLARISSPWLDTYINYSKKWAPNAYDGYHEAVALWSLSTVAARRIAVPIGGLKYTGLYIAMVGRTSVFTKTTAAKVGIKLLGAAGLNFLLCPDEMTPQAFIEHLSTVPLPKNYNDLSEKDQEWFKSSIAFAGQKGWYYDEFGQKVSGMMKEGGHMAEYRGILRRFDNDEDKYDYRSRSHGIEIVKRPYLALLGSMTPADLKPYAKAGSALWNDGFWARYAFVAPGEETQRGRGRWPNELQTIPSALVQPLNLWHKRLGTPHVSIDIPDPLDSTTKKTGVTIEVADVDPTVMGLPTDVYDAFYAYKDALDDIVASDAVTDLDGNYSRLPEKTIRVAALLASFHGEKDIKLQHWHRALEIAERWRIDLHSLYRQLSGDVEASRGRNVEDSILTQLEKHGSMSANDLRRWCNLSAREIHEAIPALLKDGSILEVQDRRWVKYTLVRSS